MDPIMIATIVAAVAEALKFAVNATELLKDGQHLTPEEIQARWTAMNEHYAASRRAWDDAGDSKAKE